MRSFVTVSVQCVRVCFLGVCVCVVFLVLAGVFACAGPAECQCASPGHADLPHRWGRGRVVRPLRLSADLELHRHEEPGGGGAATGDGDPEWANAERGPEFHIKVESTYQVSVTYLLQSKHT